MTSQSMPIVLIVVFSVVGLALYVLMMTGMMFAFKKAGLRHPWLAYIPIAQYFLYLKVIRINRWHLLWMLLPLAVMPLQHHGVLGLIVYAVVEIFVCVLGIWWNVRYFKAFGMNPHRLWWILFPVIGVILVIIFELQIGFSSKYQYRYQAS